MRPLKAQNRDAIDEQCPKTCRYGKGAHRSKLLQEPFLALQWTVSSSKRLCGDARSCARYGQT